MEITIRKIGNSEGAIFPKEMLAKLRVSEGDKLYITEAPDGMRISTYDADFVRTMEVAEKVMREDRDVLKKLAE